MSAQNPEYLRGNPNEIRHQDNKDPGFHQDTTLKSQVPVRSQTIFNAHQTLHICFFMSEHYSCNAAHTRHGGVFYSKFMALELKVTQTVLIIARGQNTKCNYDNWVT